MGKEFLVQDEAPQMRNGLQSKPIGNTQANISQSSHIRLMTRGTEGEDQLKSGG